MLNHNSLCYFLAALSVKTNRKFHNYCVKFVGNARLRYLFSVDLCSLSINFKVNVTITIIMKFTDF